MKTLNLLILLFVAGVTISQGQAIIYGVESFGQWDSTAAGELPTNWDGFNRQVIINGMNLGEVICVTKDSSDPQDMDYAVRIENKSILGGSAVPGMLTCGHLQIDFASHDGNINGGVPYNQTPSSFKGWYKYNPALGDSALISVWFKQNGNKIGGGKIYISNTTNIWSQYNVNLSYTTGSKPDTVIILFSSSYSKNNVPLGSILDIDHIWFEGGSLSNKSFETKTINYSVFPNPTTDILNITVPRNREPIFLNIYNITGKRLIRTKFNTDNYKQDISKLAKGTYYLELKTPLAREITRIIIE